MAGIGFSGCLLLSKGSLKTVGIVAMRWGND